MPTPNSFGLEFREDPSLPAQTLIAPIGVVREIRAALGEVRFNIQVTWETEAVTVSSDLFVAFNQWSTALASDEEETPVDEGLYN
ncbi:MAG: hypothetical protein DWH91_06055 [Planctomycetota bacterium]|nr:MAG: hypothetical protein DWH91_06055 [Planctomycetota bacterium]